MSSMTDQESTTITLTIDEMPIAVQSGLTVLEAAQKNGIYIPTLCAYKGLSPYGGCRLCLVQIEGRSQYLSACTTPVAAGMIVHTNNPDIHALRKEMLSLILSEHPAGCLFCSENTFCDSNMTTLCKTEWVTGCHNCPQNGVCELQQVVAALGLTQVKYPTLTKKFVPETFDPFYDRDDNLCILCGRCIRACQEYRLAEVISFQQRGAQTRVGTAFGRSRLEADCEFCGLCVTVCPTGALAEKTRKWLGPADKEVQTTCPFCGLGCQIQLQVKGKEVIGSLPIKNSEDHLEQLCVKGRFAAFEVLNQPQRLTKPYLWENGIQHYLNPSEAVQLAAEKLSACPSHQFGLVLSADCTNEELYIARKFTQQAMNSPYIENLSRFAYGDSFGQMIHLLSHQAERNSLENAQVILSIGFDGRYNQSVIGVKIKQALLKGAVLITLHPNEHHLARHAKLWLKPEAGKESNLLQNLIDCLRGNVPTAESIAPKDVRQASEILSALPKRALLIGSHSLHKEHSASLFRVIDELLQTLEFTVISLPLQSNFVGSLQLQTFSEFQHNLLASIKQDFPGDPSHSWILAADLNGEQKKDGLFNVLYYFNTVPHPAFHQAEFTICQHISELDNLPSPALVLPSASFAEMDGTLLDGFGERQVFQKAIEPPEEAQAGWQWLCKIARQMGKTGFDFSSMKEIEKEIMAHYRKFGSFAANMNSAASSLLAALKAVPNQPSMETFTFYPYTDENIYLGVPLRKWVGGLDDLYLAQEK